jgi:ATP-dependent Clp protease ATP-binding subunit ClpC
MNESTLLKLKVIVERAVRPVRASLSRKKKMREEFLGHVTSVFEEEFRRCGDESAALIQTEMRFGNPRELASKLQESLPKWDRFALLCEHLIAPRVGESLVRRAGRYGLMVFACDLIFTIALAPLIFPLSGKANEFGTITYIFLAANVTFGVITFVGTLLTNWLIRAFFDSSGRSLFESSIPVILSCFVPVLIRLVFSVSTCPFNSENGVLFVPALWTALPATFMAPLVLIGMAKLLSDEKRYREDWSRLQID